MINVLIVAMNVVGQVGELLFMSTLHSSIVNACFDLLQHNYYAYGSIYGMHYALQSDCM